MNHLTLEQLEAGIDAIGRSPQDNGVLKMIVRRPEIEAREVLQEGQLGLAQGLVGDNWQTRGSLRTPDGSAHPDMQLNIINARLIALIAQSEARWSLAGDQLYVDLDLGVDNLPAGTQLAIGSAVVEVTAIPHTGCKKFMARFGLDALKFVNSPTGKNMRLRGLNARVVQPGVIRVNDCIKKL